VLDHAVQSDAFPGFDNEHCADRHVLRRQLAHPAAVLDAYGFRSDGDQGLHGPPGAADAPRFERERKGEQKGDGGGLEPFTDAHRPENGNDHEQVHVRSQGLGGEPRPRRDIPRAAHDADEIQRPGRPRHAVDQTRAFGTQRLQDAATQDGISGERGGAEHPACDRQQCPEAPYASLFSTGLNVILRRPRLGMHPGSADGFDHRLSTHAVNSDHTHAATKDVEGEFVVAADNGTDFPPQDRAFFGAVHSANAKVHVGPPSVL
jgi:hypothetical protein